jgi:hypothetical protein
VYGQMLSVNANQTLRRGVRNKAGRSSRLVANQIRPCTGHSVSFHIVARAQQPDMAGGRLGLASLSGLSGTFCSHRQIEYEKLPTTFQVCQIIYIHSSFL